MNKKYGSLITICLAFVLVCTTGFAKANTTQIIEEKVVSFDRTPIDPSYIPDNGKSRAKETTKNIATDKLNQIVKGNGNKSLDALIKEKEINLNKGILDNTSFINSDFEIDNIIGSDDRVKISDTTVSPYNAIAYIITRHPNGLWYGCSGFFIDHNSVLTSAHCVYDTYNNYWYTDSYVYPAMNGNYLPYDYRYSGYMNFWVPQAYQDSGAISFESNYYANIKNDYAIINLPDSYSVPNYFNLRGWTHDDGEGLIVAGYPGDKSGDNGDSYMYKANGTATYDESYDVLIHNADTNGGQSGSPVYNSKSGFLGVVGVHSAGGSSNNYAAEITSTVYSNVTNWAGLSFIR